jgi:hypothetical protein
MFAALKIGDGRSLEALRQVLLQQPIGTLAALLTTAFLQDRASEQIPIEPGFHFKNVLLLVLGQRLPAVTEAEVYQIAVALCSAAASGYDELQLHAFSCLKVLIDRFRLESLGGQFAQLTEIALGLDLSITGGFLSACLKGGNLRSCIQPLLRVTNSTENYFALTAKVIRESADQRDCLAPFVDRLLSPFTAIIKQVMKTRQPLRFGGLYKDLPAAFVVLQKLSGRTEIPPPVLFSYFGVELSDASDPSVAEGDVAGANAVLDQYPDDVEIPLVLELFTTAVNHQLLSAPDVRAAVVALSLRISRISSLPDSAWDSLLYTVVNIGIHPETAARVIDRFPRAVISPHSPAIAARALREISAPRQLAALFRILVEKASAPVLASQIILWAEEAPSRSACSFRLLEAVGDSAAAVGEFARRRLRRGGLEFAVRKLRSGDVSVMAKVAEAAASSAVSDSPRAGLWLALLTELAEKVARPELEAAVARVALQIVARGNTTPEVTTEAARLVNAWQSSDKEACQSAWEALGEPDRERWMTALLNL